MDNYSKLKDILLDKLHGVKDEQLVREATFTKDLGADSIDLVEVIMAVEEAFEIEISDDEIENIITVGDALRILEEKC